MANLKYPKKYQTKKPKSRKAKYLRLIIFLVGIIIVSLISHKIISLNLKDDYSIKINPTEQSLDKNLIKDLEYPSQIIDMTNWKLTLPIGKNESPLEIRQPGLSNYELSPWFVADPENKFVTFRAAVNGVTTSGSDYPRSELREMTNNGSQNASWSTDNGKHSIFIDQKISAVPKTKNHVVIGQIHDKDNDVIVIRLDYPVLHIRVDGKIVQILDNDYQMGKRFSFKFDVKDNQTMVFYNNSSEPVYTLNKNYSNAYFKAGIYTQSNCVKEISRSLCNEDNYGETNIYQIIVNHE